MNKNSRKQRNHCSSYYKNNTKKKREDVGSYSDLRCLSIVPNLLMVHDKIIYSIIVDMLEPKLIRIKLVAEKD